jgi:hypothetical protein
VELNELHLSAFTGLAKVASVILGAVTPYSLGSASSLRDA